MNDSLKEKTISGFFWYFTQYVLDKGVLFGIGIILNKLLTPSDFGVFTIIIMVVTFSNILLNNGMSIALIRQKELNNNLSSSVFYFNILLGFLFSIIIYISSNYISLYFNEPQLASILKITCWTIFISSFNIIQISKLSRELDFKSQAKISFISNTVSGIISIVFAFYGFGIWSLVIKIMLQYIINTILLFYFVRWTPKLYFSIHQIKTILSFSVNIQFTNILEFAFQNFNNIIVGKYKNFTQLGYFNRAQQFNGIISDSVNSVIMKVSYPLLSRLSANTELLKTKYIQILKYSILISFFFHALLYLNCENIILLLLGEKWFITIQYTTLLCFSTVIYPIHSLNINLLFIMGKSKNYLIIELIKKILTIPTFIILLYFGVYEYLISFIVLNQLALGINSYYTGKNINFGYFQQIKIILFYFFINFGVAFIINIIFGFIIMNNFLLLIIKTLIYFFVVFIVFEIIKPKTYIELKEKMLQYYLKYYGKNN